MLLNSDSYLPTYSSIHGESYIDITISTINFVQFLGNLKVREDWTTSDHRCITFKVYKNRNRPNTYFDTNRVNHKRADWDLFYDALMQWFTDEKLIQYERMAMDDIAVDVQEGLQYSCKRFMRKKKYNPKHVPWWSDELTKLRKEVNSARNYIREKGKMAPLMKLNY